MKHDHDRSRSLLWVFPVYCAKERDHWKFKDRDETKNRSFVMSHDKIEPLTWERL